MDSIETLSRWGSAAWTCCVTRRRSDPCHGTQVRAGSLGYPSKLRMVWFILVLCHWKSEKIMENWGVAPCPMDWKAPSMKQSGFDSSHSHNKWDHFGILDIWKYRGSPSGLFENVLCFSMSTCLWEDIVQTNPHIILLDLHVLLYLHHTRYIPIIYNSPYLKCLMCAGRCLWSHHDGEQKVGREAAGLGRTGWVVSWHWQWWKVYFFPRNTD